MDLRSFVQSFTVLDWVLVSLVAASMITGFMRGIIRSLFSLGGILAGIVLAGWYSGSLAVRLAPWISAPTAAHTVAFVIILLTAMVLSVLLGHLVRSAASLVGLSFADRLAGAGFGFFRGYLLLSALLLPLVSVVSQNETARSSTLLPYFLSGAHGISFLLPRDFKEQIAAGMQHLQK